MPASVNVRELALETLLLITRDGQYSHIALKGVLDKYQYLEKKERAFITRVVEGTLERMTELDYIIDCFSKTKVSKMKPVIREILRSAVYQIKYMDGVPDRAVCDEAVKLAVRKGFSGLRGFVNGVLRTVIRELPGLAWPGEDEPERHLSVKYSLPLWLVRQWLSEYDRETLERMGSSFLEERRTCIRCDLTKTDPAELAETLRSEGVTAERDPEMPEALYISGYDHLSGLESFRKGYFYVQDISSMRVAEWADPERGDCILDVCAAPGGKAIHLAEKLSGTGSVTARDLTDYKVGLIRDNIEKSGLANITAEQWDATVYDESWRSRADIVIADLPCSGLGVIGRKADIRFRMTPELEESLAKLQREILSVVCAYVKPGGRLIYSTCTVHRAENEENVGWFLKEHPEYSLLRERQFLPGMDSGDGFYIAVLEKGAR